ncbi:tetratricopeptide repeat protein [Flavobacterium okayamense]|uniref:Tetratricopeptide repeat-containing protein n=1 Tax=Flavobacterium okayamense TaxID=2830782 RepID=A0ABN6HV92_9FLAO|nr:tetratricopeptide repeat protein [Flavobacterium okayamense]BCY28281.1 hypothetical protein KK2020170_11490 [Flavobacterium okayamense]
MNTNDFTYLLNKPQTINEKQTQVLESILQEFPFFQSARALYLKGLFNQESYRYNYELKKTAAHTQDRTILFEFITSDEFTTLQKNNIEAQEEIISNIKVNEVEFVEIASSQAEVGIPTKIEEELEIGKPLSFENNEKHSFSEWLQLTQFAPIDRNEEEKEVEFEDDKSKKFDLIDKFIENNPKISPTKESTTAPSNIAKSAEEPTHLMTETLAKIYLEQKKYQRAIQAYEILILKYPEKSSFFADRIENIKKLQQNNN